MVWKFKCTWGPCRLRVSECNHNIHCVIKRSNRNHSFPSLLLHCDYNKKNPLYVIMLHIVNSASDPELEEPWMTFKCTLHIPLKHRNRTVSVQGRYLSNIIGCVLHWEDKPFCFCQRVNDYGEPGRISTHFIVSSLSDLVGFDPPGKHRAEILLPLVAAWWISLWAWLWDCTSSPMVKCRQTTARLPSTCSLIELFSFPLIY